MACSNVNVSACELAQLQSDAASAVCDQACTITRATLTDEPQGGHTSIRSTVVITLAGLQMPSATQLQNFGFETGSLAAWIVRLPIGTDVRSEDWLLIGSDVLIVNRVKVPQSYPILITLLATEVG